MMETKEIAVTWSNVPNISDVLCICEPWGRGAVSVLANARGRACLHKIFPTSQPSWEPNASMLPADWLHADFFVPQLARHEHALPPIYGHVPLQKASPASLAYLLAYAVKTHGARAMIYSEESDPPLQLLSSPQN